VTEVTCVLDAKAELGEGPVWSAEEQALYWVDIYALSLDRLDPATGENRSWSMPDTIGSFGLRWSVGAVVALRGGFHLFDFDIGTANSWRRPTTSSRAPGSTTARSHRMAGSSQAPWTRISCRGRSKRSAISLRTGRSSNRLPPSHGCTNISVPQLCSRTTTIWRLELMTPTGHRRELGHRAEERGTAGCARHAGVGTAAGPEETPGEGNPRHGADIRRPDERYQLRRLRAPRGAPESAIGGPLALVRDGDIIELDVTARRLDLKVDDDELDKRRAD
jgi:SMP-30/Gluconolactonase/LRE-like region/Dehydratase family